MTLDAADQKSPVGLQLNRGGGGKTELLYHLKLSLDPPPRHQLSPAITTREAITVILCSVTLPTQPPPPTLLIVFSPLFFDGRCLFVFLPSAFLKPTLRHHPTPGGRRKRKAKNILQKRKSCTLSTSLSDRQKKTKTSQFCQKKKVMGQEARA